MDGRPWHRPPSDQLLGVKMLRIAEISPSCVAMTLPEQPSPDFRLDLEVGRLIDDSAKINESKVPEAVGPRSHKMPLTAAPRWVACGTEPAMRAR
jgi:hypothetical protein